MIDTNYYIHGTNSNILSLLPRTEFKVMGPIEMIEKYELVPMSGEINGGGLSSAPNRCHPCFGRLREDNINGYNLDKVLTKYANIPDPEDQTDSFTAFEHQVKIATTCGFSNINVLLIFMMRCQQEGIDIKEHITDNFINQAKMTCNAFASLLMFHTWLRPYSSQMDTNLTDAVYTHFNLKSITNKLTLNSPDFLNIYLEYKDNSLPENIKEILADIFILPKITIIQSGFSAVDKEVSLDVVSPFIFSDVDINSDYESYEPKYTCYRLVQDCSGYRINDVLEKYAGNGISGRFWISFHKELIKYLGELKYRISLLEKMRNRLTVPKVSITYPLFPLILICKNDEIMEPISNEYRSTRALSLGTDIEILVTDTNINKSHLIDFLNVHNIKCSVILFEELKTIK